MAWSSCHTGPRPSVGESVSLFREPDAGNLHVRFDEQEQETGQAKPDCGGCSESPTQQPPGDYRYCACSRLYSQFHSQSEAFDLQERTANIASCFTSGAPLRWLDVDETVAPSEPLKYPRLPSLEHPLTSLLITDASPAGHVPLASTASVPSVVGVKSPFHQLTPVLANKRRKVVRTLITTAIH